MSAGIGGDGAVDPRIWLCKAAGIGNAACGGAWNPCCGCERSAPPVPGGSWWFIVTGDKPGGTMRRCCAFGVPCADI